MTTLADIRPLTLEEAETLVGWAKDEGWNPGLHDAERFYAFDPQAFIGCIVDGELAAGISAISYDGTFGFIGLYICRPDMRGKGIGKRVWDAGMARLDGHVIGLDGVPEQQANYASMGFQPTYSTWRWSGTLASSPTPNSPTSDTTPFDATIGAELATFDRRFFPAPRGAFLREWVKPPHETAVIQRNGHICGYGVLRHCVEGFKIGPLFAETYADAIAIFRQLAVQANGESIHIDVPETAAGFSAFLQQSGFDRGFVTARMYRGTPPDLPKTGIYGTTTLELG